MLLKGKNILVTGGSRGLGRRLCVTFAREGANVAFNYAADEKGARETEAAAAAFGPAILAVKASVLNKDEIGEMIARIEKEWGGVDVLVNNAGVSQTLPMALLEEEDWDEVMDINVKGVYLVTRAALRGMIRARRGKILNIGSLAGVRVIESPVHYAASKAAIKGFTASLAKEMGRYGITVNSIAPGILEGGVGAALPSYRLKDYLKHCALGRVGGYAEVSELAAFMVSDENSYMNGVTLVMDGGL
ncbi:MAG: SDR family oxidoreductase [Desulfobacterales bacterium]|nr:SDR family oxidoreductase [Desulfobacterales bacterium]